MLRALKNLGNAFTLLLLAINDYCKKNFSFKHVFCLDGILKLTFLYSVMVIYIIIFYFHLPAVSLASLGLDPRVSGVLALHETLADLHPRETVAIYSCNARAGEVMLQNRVVLAAKNLGWRVIDARFPEGLTTYSLTRSFFTAAASIVNLIYDPKFNLAVTHHVYVVPYGYNITYLNMPRDALFGLNQRFHKQYSHLEEYDAYGDLYSLPNDKNEILDNALKAAGRSGAPIIPLYLGEDHMEYIPPKSRDKALVIGTLWGCNRGSQRMLQALQKLAKNDYLIAYGQEDLDFLGSAYKGPAEVYGKEHKLNSLESLAGLHRKFGISLVLHSLEHMVDGIPTSRISEAVSSGAIAISDDNAFMRKYFGNNVLYVNTIAQSDEIYEQLKEHIDWIRSHPEEAEAMALRAYDILEKDFMIGPALQRLMDMRNGRQ